MSCTNSEIHDLLIQLQQGNDEAVEQLFACIADVLCTRAVKQGLSYEDSDDAVQETMLRILKGIDTYNKRGGWGWIWAIHSRVTIDFFRKNLRHQGKEPPLNYIDENSLVSGENPEQDIINKESTEELRKALNYMFEHISVEDRAMLLRKKRGPKPKEWHEAVKRARSVLEDYNKDAKS
jgi:DNA-directed RNA polymerase specialized sigma24 family protein